MSDFASYKNRLAKNVKHWGKWARRNGISCYRLYDRDVPEFPVVVDWYAGRVHLQRVGRAARCPASSAGRPKDSAARRIASVPYTAAWRAKRPVSHGVMPLWTRSRARFLSFWRAPS